MKVEDAQKILEIYKSKDYSDIHTHFDLNWKRNIWVPIYNLSEFNFVKNLINEDLQKVNPNYFVSEVITLLEYNEGDFFGVHQDGTSYQSAKDVSILSGGYLLNDSYEGGDFIIKNKKINVGIGEMFTFSRSAMHEVTEVTKGVRYSIHFVVNKPKNKKSIL